MSRNVIVRNATEFYEYARAFLSKPKDEPSDVCCHTPHNAASFLLMSMTSIEKDQTVSMLKLYQTQDRNML